MHSKINTKKIQLLGNLIMIYIIFSVDIYTLILVL